MPDPQQQNLKIRFIDKGLVTKTDPSQLQEGQWASRSNVQSYQEGSISSRSGREELPGNIPGTSPTHTMKKLILFTGADTSNPRYIGNNKNIYRTTDYFTKFQEVAAGVSPNATVDEYEKWGMAPYSAGATGKLEAYFACRSAMLKDNGSLTTLQNWGILPAFGVATGVASNLNINFQVFSGVGVNDLSAGGTYTGSTTINIIIKVTSAGTITPGWNGTTTYTSGDIVFAAYSGGAYYSGYGTGSFFSATVHLSNMGQYPISNNGYGWILNSSYWTYAPVQSIPPDQWSYSLDGGATWTVGGDMATAPILVGAWNGVSVQWSSVNGHTVGDYWTISVVGDTANTPGLLDGGATNSPAGASAYGYVYCYVNSGAVSSGSIGTGNYGNPSQYMLADSEVTGGTPVAVHLGQVTVTVWGTGDPQISQLSGANSIAIYRIGGILPDAYRLVGFVTNPGLTGGPTSAPAYTTFVDNTSDVNLQPAAILNTYNDPPVPSSLPTPWQTTIASGSSPTGTGFQTVHFTISVNTLNPGCVISFLGTNVQETAEIVAITGANTALLYLQYSHSANEQVGCYTLVNAKATACCEAFDSIFIARDPNNPHVLYKSATGFPESFPVSDAAGNALQINVGNPSNPIMALAGEFRGCVVCLNLTNIFEVPIIDGVMYSPQVAPAQAGLIAPHAWCYGLNAIYFLSYDGIYAWSGGNATKISEPIDPIFRGEVYNGIQPLGTAYLAQTSMSFLDNEITLAYYDDQGTGRLLVYEAIYNRWLMMDATIPTAMNAEPDIGSMFVALTIGGNSVFAIDGLGTSDEYPSTDSTGTLGLPIDCSLTSGWIGSTESDWLLQNLVLDVEPGAEITVNLFYNYSTTAGDTLTIPAQSGRVRYCILPLVSGFPVGTTAPDGMEVFNFQMQFTWSGTTRTTLHSVDCTYSQIPSVTKSALVQFWKSYQQSLGVPGWKALIQMWIAYKCPSAVSVHIISDYGTYGILLPPHAIREVERFYLPAVFGPGLNKSKLYGFTVSSPNYDLRIYEMMSGVEFVVYGEDQRKAVQQITLGQM